MLGGYDGSARRPERARDDRRQRLQECRDLPGAGPLSRGRRRAATRSTSSVARPRPAGRPTPFRRSTRQPGPPGSLAHLPQPRLPRGGGRPGRPDLRARRDGGRLGDRPRSRASTRGPGHCARRARCPSPVSNAAAATSAAREYLIGGLGKGGTPLDSVVRLTLKSVHAPAPPPPRPPARHDDHLNEHDQHLPGRRERAARLPGPPADRRPRQQPAARRQRRRSRSSGAFPRAPTRRRPGGFYFPDDAFFTHGGTGIISNEEQNERIVQLAFPSGKLLWSYGHPGVTGSEPGLPARARRRLPAEGRHGHGRRCPELPRPAHLPRRRRSCRLRQPGGLHPRTAPHARLAERRHAARQRQHPGLRGERLLHRRDHPAGQARLERAPADRLSLRPPAARARTATWSPTTRGPAGIYEFNRAGQDPLVLPPVLGTTDAQPPEPRRAAAERPDRRPTTTTATAS